MINVQVVYAMPDKQKVIDVAIANQATVRETIEQSNVLQTFPEIDLNHNKVGIYGEIVTLETIVSEADRVEIYRALTVDPMQARRLRAKKKK